MIKQFLLLLVLAILCFLLLPARAQEVTPAADAGAGRGVVTLADASGACADGYCAALVGLLLPSLFDIDPATGALLGADVSDRALARVVPPDLPTDEVTLELADRQWSDGQPVTAYDVLFSLMLYQLAEREQVVSGAVLGARIIDERTIALRFTETAAELAELTPAQTPRTPTCDALPRANIYLVSYRLYSPGFRDFAEQHAPAGDAPSLVEWWRAYNDAQQPYPYRAASSALITSGAYRTLGDGQFVPADGSGAALRLISALPEQFVRPNTIDAFIAGTTNVLLDVPVSERAGLRRLAAADARSVQVAEVPGLESLIIVLNLGNPARPLPGIHPETGAILDQGRHPLFSDPAVRRALQLALDPDALIDGVLQRSAVPLAGLYPPSSWAFDPTLARVETNLQAARQLLDEAGWKDNGVVRVCTGCATAEEGTQLRFALASNGGDYTLADEITKQWARIGVQAFGSGEGRFLLASQSFDAYLARVGGSAYEDADPDRTLLLTPAGDFPLSSDIVGSPFLNYGSYNNPEVTDLLAQARTLPGCDLAGRAALYRQVERILQQDLPFIPVVAPTEFYAAAPGVLGFAPRTGDPLWNVESWVVAS